jgi:hypothetical protein
VGFNVPPPSLFLLIRSLAREIIMSIPSLYKKGAVFLIFPARQASYVVGRQDRQYIASILMEVADEIPIAGAVGAMIQASDNLEE